MEYVLLAVLLVAAIFIIVAVIFQKSDEGLSGAIAGGNETYYGKEKSGGAGSGWFKWTLIASIVFAIAVLVAYIVQPDYGRGALADVWQQYSNYSYLFS